MSGPPNEKGNLVALHRALAASRERGERSGEKWLSEWCAKSGIIVTGEAGIDMLLDNCLSERGAWSGEISAEAVEPALSELARMRPGDRFEVVGKGGLHVKVILAGTSRILIDLTVREADAFSRLPTSDGPGGVKVLALGAAVRRYFRLLAFRQVVNLAPEVGAALKRLRRIGECLANGSRSSKEKARALPPPPVLNSPEEMKRRLESVERLIPLLPDCYYAGTTGYNILFGAAELPSERKSIEVICFGKTYDTVGAYREKYDYSTYEVFHDAEWESAPSRIVLEPSQTSELPPLVLLDGSTLCGQCNGKVLSPISLAAMAPEGTDIPLLILSFLLRSPEPFLTVFNEEKHIGGCIFGPYIAALGARLHVNRSDYVSSRQYFNAVLSAQERSERRREEHGDGRGDRGRGDRGRGDRGRGGRDGSR